MDETKGGRVGERLEEFKCHWQWVLLGLSRSIITNSWLLVSLDRNAYSDDIWLRRYGIKYRSVKAIVTI